MVVVVASALPMAVSATAAATPAVATVCVPLVVTALGLVVLAGFACCGGVGLGDV